MEVEITEEHQPEVFQLGPILSRTYRQSAVTTKRNGPHRIDRRWLNVGRLLPEAERFKQERNPTSG
jgi:hypothetical protein